MAGSSKRPTASIERARSVFSSVFLRSDPYVTPFTEAVEGRRIVFPTDVFGLTCRQAHAVRAAATETFGERTAFLAPIEGPGRIESRASDSVLLRIVDLDEPTSFYQPSLDIDEIDGLQTALFSTDGNWGLLVSDEEHAVIGGSQSFIDRFNAELPESPDMELKAWLEQWAGNARGGYAVEWLVPLLEHMYGRSRAEAVLTDLVSDEIRHRLLSARTSVWSEEDAIREADTFMSKWPKV